MVKLLLFFTLSLSYAVHGAFSENGTDVWGIDSEITHVEATEKSRPSLKISQKICVEMIHFFQNYISPIDGPRSSYYPSSSRYTLEAIQKHGVMKGILIGCDRLLRENGDLWVYQTTDRFGVKRKLDPVR